MVTRQPLTKRDLLLLTTPDDTEDAPWMVMSDQQWHAVDQFMSILNLHVERQGLPWYTASYLKITMPRGPGERSLDVAPDAFVVEAERHMRDSWNVIAERKSPQFVLEVLGEKSWTRDAKEKPDIYDAMGVREYALFWPRRPRGGPLLFGYRRSPMETFVPWETDDQGMLRSSELGGLRLHVEDQQWLRLVDLDGKRLPTEAEEAAARYDAERRAAEAEAEIERLRDEIRRLREQRDA